MGSISGSFSANGVSSTLALGNTPESISLTLTGTFSGKVYLERAMSTAAQAWEVVGGPYTAAGTFNYLARPTDILRARMKNFVSGTVSFTLSDGDATIHTFYDPDGNPLYRMTQGAHYFLGDVNITGNVTSGTTTLSTFGNADFFRFGYGATRPLVKMQSAGTDAAGAAQQVLSISHQVTHSGTGGAGAIGALYSASTIDGGPDQDYYAAAFTMTNRAKRSVTATPDQAQHGTLFTHQVKDLPTAGFSPGDVMADSWVQWWVAQDRTNLPSSQGGAFVGVEFDIFGNNQDDAVGKKRFARQVVLNNYAGDAAHPLEWGYGDYWNSFTGGAQDTFFNTVIALYAGWTNAAIDLSQGTGARSNPYVDGTNRGVAIKMRDGAKLSFNGDGATGSYLTRGSNRLQYWSGGAEKWSVSDAGDVVFSGGTFGPSDYRQIEINPSGVEDFGAGSPQILRVRRVGSDNTVGVNFTNLWVTRSSWVLTDTTAPAGTRFNAVFDSSSGAGIDPGAVWNTLSTHTTSASEDSLSAVSAYVQMVRAGVPGGAKKGIQAEALVVEMRDASDASSATGGLSRTLELDLFANGADDYVGAVGREVMPILLGKHNAGGASPTITSLIGVYPVIGDGVSLTRGITFANQLSFTESLWDTRDSVQGANANAIWLKSGHKIAFDGTSVGSGVAPSHYLSHSSSALRASGTFVAANTGAAPITLASGSISVPASQNLAIQVSSAAQSINFGASGAGLGQALSVTMGSNGNSLFGASPSNVLVTNRLTAASIFSTGTTINLSGTVTPTAITGNGSTVTVTFPAVAGFIIPVGSTVTTTGFTPSGYNETNKVVTASTSTTLTYASTATGTMTVAGSMAYKMTPPDLIRFSSNWTGEAAAVGAAFSPYAFTISSDTALTNATGHGAAVVDIAHNWSGAATGGKLGMQVTIAQTGATNDPGTQQHVVANLHAQAGFNAGGTGTGLLAKGTLYGTNPQVRLLYGATRWRATNALGEVNSSTNASEQPITLTGTATAGDVVTLTFTSADIVGSPVAVTHTVGASQTMAMIANGLSNAINTNTALRNAQIAGVSWTGNLVVKFNPHIAALTITPSVSGGATVTAGKGTLVNGASVDIKIKASFIPLSDDDQMASLGSVGIMFGRQFAPAHLGQYQRGIAFNGHPQYSGAWMWSADSTLIGSNITTSIGNLDASSPQPSNISKYGVDWQLVNFTLSGGRAFRSSNFEVGGSGVLYLGGAVVTPSSSGLSIDVTGKTASSIAIASGGGGGAGQVIGNYFPTSDVGFDDWSGQYQVAGVDASTGAATSLNVLSFPSYPSGSPPANPLTVNGGSGRGLTVNATWPTTTTLSLQPSGGTTTLGGALSTPGPVTKTGNFTMAATETTVICNGAGSITVTLPAASSSTGQWRTIKTIAAQTVVSATSNIVPLVGGAAGTAILAATAGKWVDLQSDGTNWVAIRGN